MSRTRLERTQYSFDSLAPLLHDVLQLSKTSYNRHGLTVLRATVMNPFYYTALAEGIDYLAEYVRYLHCCARKCLAAEGPRHGAEVPSAH
ncbi:MAG: hypothetical protein JWM95_375 [Gemmatimonadetes bacterium]|nr:hypothetical protein [Gemmatimonadota bacterium]